jgi:hypothetical protein
MEWLLGLPDESRAKRCPGSGPSLVSCVSADPSEPSLAPQTAEALAPIPPTLHPTLSRDAPETPRSTSYQDKRYYGESPMGLRRDERAVGMPSLPLPRKQRRTVTLAFLSSPGMPKCLPPAGNSPKAGSLGKFGLKNVLLRTLLTF